MCLIKLNVNEGTKWIGHVQQLKYDWLYRIDGNLRVASYGGWFDARAVNIINSLLVEASFPRMLDTRKEASASKEIKNYTISAFTSQNKSSKSDLYHVRTWPRNNKLVIRYPHTADIAASTYWLSDHENCLFWVVCMCALFLAKKKWNSRSTFYREAANSGIQSD